MRGRRCDSFCGLGYIKAMIGNSTSNSKLGLIVDNNEDDIKNYSFCLEQLEFHIEVCRSEQETLSYLNTHSPHIAFVHFRREIERTINFIAQIHSIDPTICIFYITGYDGQDVRIDAMKAGAHM